MVTFGLAMFWKEWFICYIWKIKKRDLVIRLVLLPNLHIIHMIIKISGHGKIYKILGHGKVYKIVNTSLFLADIVFSQQSLLIITGLVFSVEIFHFHFLPKYFPEMIRNHLPRSILLVMISVGSIFQFILAISASSLYLRNTNKLMTRTATKITASTTETTRPTGSLVSFSMQKKIRSD